MVARCGHRCRTKSVPTFMHKRRATYGMYAVRLREDLWLTGEGYAVRMLTVIARRRGDGVPARP